MLRFVTGRVLAMVPIFLGVVFLAMLLVSLMPGDPASVLAGEGAPRSQVLEIRHELRLDEPLWERYGHYVGGLFHGSLGRSPVSHLDIWHQLWTALPVTLSLVLVSMVMAIALGTLLGTWAALEQGGRVDRVIVAVVAVMQAIPPFVIGFALVVVLAVQRSWLPPGGYAKFGEGPWEWFVHLLLPSFTLALALAAQLTRQIRAALLDVLEQDYIRAVRAKGLSNLAIVGKHAAKNAATPVVTVIGLQVGALIGGALVVEVIYAMPGFGSVALTAVLSRDVPMIQGAVVVGAMVVLVANLLVDVSYGYFNPKVRV